MSKPIPICQDITTRNGTLSKDSYMSNFYAEQDNGGTWDAVLRPGSTLAMSPSTYGTVPAAAQNLCSFGNYVFSITQKSGNDVLACVNYTLPLITMGATSNARYTTLNSIYTSAGNWLTTIQEPFSLWVLSSNSVVTKVTSSAYPAQTVRGIAYLDGSWYVMTPYGQIFGSNIDDPNTWTALNNIFTDRGIGAGVSIIRHLNYVVAFCDEGIQFFYDAGNPTPGSALLALPNGTYPVGCVAAVSIVQIEQLTIFMAKTTQKGRTINALSGLSIVPMSNPYIDKILDLSNLQTIYAWGVRIAGHSHYIISLADLGITLDLDISTQKWCVWSSGSGIYNGAYYLNPILTVALAPIGDFVQGVSDGCVYLLDPTVGTDNGTVIQATIVTQEYGNGLELSRCPTLQVIGDTVNANLQVQYTDDDYNTYSNPAPVDMSFIRKQITRLGSFRRRAFKFSYAGGVPFRVKAFLIGKTQGKDDE